MDPIQGYNQNQPRVGQSRSDFSGSTNSASKKVSSSKTPADSVSLTDLSAISDKIEQSEPDIRPDAIARAQALLNDPNWLSDENLDSLAERLIEVEEI